MVCFLKAPRSGTVKTRLAVAVGEERAVAIYRRLVEQQISAIPPQWRCWVAFAPADADEVMRAWLEPIRLKAAPGTQLAFVPQPEGDLGDRLHAGLSLARRLGRTPVLAIGGDCPALNRARFELAERALRTHDAVIGPARDGGYYLLGLHVLLPELFRGIDWSTDRVAAQTRERLRARRQSWAELPVEDDVDDLASLQRVQAAGLLPL